MWKKKLKRKILSALSFLPDEMYLKLYYLVKTGKHLKLETPILYNEKLQWLKLHDHNPLYSVMVDKYEMKGYVADIVGEKYTIPTLGVYNTFDEIDFSLLPEKFVLKGTHDQGSVMICDKKSLDYKKIKKTFKHSLKLNFYKYCREWPYKNVKGRIIAEPLLTDGNECLTDYKFFCFNGEPKFMYISRDLATSPTTDFYDMDFNKINMRMRDPNSNTLYDKPSFFDEMKQLASKLSHGIPHLRVDFYYANNNIYVGELTFFPNGGFCDVHPEDWNRKLGEMLVLPQVGEND